MLFFLILKFSKILNYNWAAFIVISKSCDFFDKCIIRTNSFKLKSTFFSSTHLAILVRIDSLFLFQINIFINAYIENLI